MKITVTKANITNGRAKDSHTCMIADAIKAACPNATYVRVDLQTIRFSNPAKGKRFLYLTPPLAQQNLLKFDLGKPVKPFSFSLNAPQTRAVHKNQTNSYERRGEKRPRRTKAHLAKYAYLAANRALIHQREREFGLRKFTEA
jgi:hypothetical protein